MEYRFKPLDRWPGERTKVRQSARFKSLWGKTQKLLAAELQHLDAKNVIIQADCDESQIRIRDGMLKAGARLNSPGVIISFESKYGPLSYPCDTFGHYQENVRAIALALEALRKVKRYGVGQRGEQYRGWKGLPDPNAMSYEEAIRIIADNGDATPESVMECPVERRAAYRRAAKKLHPDGSEGDAAEFARLGEAKRIVDSRHAL